MLASTFVSLQGFWFALLGVLWAGFLVLEGFDYGVGMLAGWVGRDEAGRRTALGTIAPVWDGNEVWLILAGGATFAAFPSWYATLFSGFYIVFFLILLGLILRGVSIEYRTHIDDPRWRSAWSLGVLVGSALPAFLFGLVFANMVHGVPIGSGGEYAGSLGDLFNGYAILGGFVSLTLFAFHGSVFLTLRTEAGLRSRAREAALGLGPLALVLTAGLLAWSWAGSGSSSAGKWIAAALLAAVAAVLLALSLVLVFRNRDGLAFAATALAFAAAVALLFVALYPNVLVSTGSGPSLTVASTASSHHTLAVMAIVALIFTPVVLAYQGWTYWVFRARLRGEPLPSPSTGPASETPA